MEVEQMNFLTHLIITEHNYYVVDYLKARLWSNKFQN